MWELGLRATDYENLLKKHFGEDVLFFFVIDDFGHVHYSRVNTTSCVLVNGAQDLFPFFKALILNLKRKGATLDFLKMKYRKHALTYKLFAVREPLLSGVYLNFFFVVHESFLDSLKVNVFWAKRDFLKRVKEFVADLRKVAMRQKGGER